MTVARILGHTNPAFTMRVYGHTVEERLRGAADTLNRHEVQNEVRGIETTKEAESSK